MERFIAIDNVCAWPNLTLLPDGTIAAVIFNQPNHGLTEGAVECWTSRDGGFLWKKQGIPVAHEPNENRLNTAAGVNNDGDFIMICTGVRLVDSTFLDLIASTSPDNGGTWSHSSSFEKPAGTDCIIPFGDIVRNDEGTLGVCVHSFDIRDKIEYVSSYFIRSHDNGRTWVGPTLIEKDINETTAISLGGQRLLAAGRTDVPGRDGITIYLSEDFGGTWVSKGTVTLPNQAPADLVRLADDSILLTYGIRNKGYQGAGARLSRDGGESWSAPAFLVDFEITTDGGYPSSVQLADGTIVTAYYSNKVPAHQRYHMGVLRWRLEEFFK